MDLLFPSAAIAAGLAFISALVAWLVVPYAARRSVAQPLDIAVEDEKIFLIGVLSDLGRLPYVTTIQISDFAAGAHARIWAALLESAEPVLSRLSAEPTEEECAELGDELRGQAEEVHVAIHRTLQSSEHARVDLERLRYLSEVSSEQEVSDEAVVEAGQVVLLTGNSRNTLSGWGRVAPSSTPDSLDPDYPPLRRILTVPSRVRRTVSALLAAVCGGLLYGLVAASGLDDVAAGLGVAALAVLMVGSLIISLVDLDTLYIDLRTFLVMSLGAWGLTIAAVGVAGAWDRILAGLIMVFGVVVLFEGANRIYRWRRGVDGQGFGDTLIVIATVGIPAALTGEWMLGYFSVMGGLVTAVLGWFIDRMRGGGGQKAPFAFGPYLAAGWLVGWVAFLLWL